MASQITHIPYGKKVLDLFLSDKKVEESKFFVGTVFPDIRYLGVIDRDKTHVFNPTIEGLRDLTDSFELGVYAHSLVDYEREKTLEKLGAYEAIEKNKLSIYAMKFVEDEVSYDLISDWSHYVDFFDHVLSEESQLVEAGAVEKWHNLLRGYFQKPTWDTVTNFAKELKGFIPEVLNAVRVEEAKIRDNRKVMEITRGTYNALFSDLS